MEIRQFRRKYDLELIPASHEGIILGTLVWDPIIGKPKFDHAGMPEHIYTAFRVSGLINDAEMTSSIDEAKNTSIVDANFAERIIEVDIDFAATLEEPKLGEIDASFGIKNIKKFSFGDLKARALTSLERVRIDEHLDTLRKEKWDDYDGKIRRVFMITELYYGSIKVVVDKSIKAEFEASIQNTNLGVSPGLEYGRSAEYTFDHKDVPFAMRLEKVKKFNG